MARIYSSNARNFWQNTKVICAVGMVVNFVISFLMLLHKQPFNVDGVWYLNAAEGFNAGGYKVASAIYPWPLYSILIGGLSKLFHLPLESAAFLLNACLTAIIVVTFILLIKKIGGSNREQYLGLLIILIFPFLNHDRYHILRDFGYYAFLLVSVLLYINYLSKLQWRYAIGWNISLIIATLFRVEGLILLTLIPFIIFIKTDIRFRQKLYGFFRIYSFMLAGSIVLLVTILFGLDEAHQLAEKLGKFSDLLMHAINIFSKMDSNFLAKQLVLAEKIIPYAPNSTLIFIIGGLSALFLQALIITLHWFYALLVGYGFKNQLLPKHEDVKVSLIGYSLIIFCTLILFLTEKFFLAERYIAPLCLLLMLIIPFSISDIYSKWQQRTNSCSYNYWLFPMVGVLLAITALDGLGHFGPSKTYIIEAGDWINQHTVSETKVYANDVQLAYYAKRPGMYYPESFLPYEEIKGFFCFDKKINLNYYNYLLFKVSYKEPEKEQELLNKYKNLPIKVFSNTRGDKVLIFKNEESIKTH